ncbi:MAG: type II CAAX endopeptidase family protein [Thermoguttaceae bacterium]
MSDPTGSLEETGHGMARHAQGKGAILGVLVAATVLVNLPLYLPVWPQLGDWLYPGMFIALGLMATVPFLLARMAPSVASFNSNWFPRAWRQWLWFVGMVVLLFVCAVVSKPLADIVPLRYTPPLLRPSFTPNCTVGDVVLTGVIAVLLCPIAEEIFWRGYLLEQLRKVTYSSVALLIQSLLFSAAHLPLIIPSMEGHQRSIAVFLYGMVLGAWRIRFRSIVPIILAHIFLNSVGSLPILMEKYDFARLGEAAGLPADFGAKLRSSPECQRIYLLTKEPTEKAVPAVIGFLASPDDVVSNYAADVLLKRYRKDAGPYLRDALASGNKRTVDRALFVVGLGKFSNLKADVRKVAWSVDDLQIQLGATIALSDLKDLEGLHDIAKKHPQEIVRRAAERCIATIEAKQTSPR